LCVCDCAVAVTETPLPCSSSLSQFLSFCSTLECSSTFAVSASASTRDEMWGQMLLLCHHFQERQPSSLAILQTVPPPAKATSRAGLQKKQQLLLHLQLWTKTTGGLFCWTKQVSCCLACSWPAHPSIFSRGSAFIYHLSDTRASSADFTARARRPTVILPRNVPTVSAVWAETKR
jgi:hypothetical protein